MKAIARNESGRKSILHNADGTWPNDDTQLASALIDTLGLLKRVACAWEQFPDLTADERRGKFDRIYDEISTLIEQLQQVDKRKGGDHA